MAIFRLTADARFEADGIEDAMRKLAEHFAAACGEWGAPQDFLLPESHIDLEAVHG